MEQKYWLVARTRPQWERIVCRQLKRWYNLDYWCPFQKVKRAYTDRMKEVEIPLFKNYVFVQVNGFAEQIKVLQLDGVIGYIKYLGKPAVVKEEVINTLKNFLEEYQQVNVTTLEVGNVVKVRDGALKGQEGIIIQIGKRKVILELRQLGFKLEAPLGAVAV